MYAKDAKATLSKTAPYRKHLRKEKKVARQGQCCPSCMAVRKLVVTLSKMCKASAWRDFHFLFGIWVARHPIKGMLWSVAHEHCVERTCQHCHLYVLASCDT